MNKHGGSNATTFNPRGNTNDNHGIELLNTHAE